MTMTNLTGAHFVKRIPITNCYGYLYVRVRKVSMKENYLYHSKVIQYLLNFLSSVCHQSIILILNLMKNWMQ